MNYITSVIAAFCASSIFIGALFMLCPDGNMSKTIKFTLSLVFLISVISAGGIAVKTQEFNFEWENIQSFSTEEIDINNAKLILGETLRREDINFKEIEIYTNKEEDGSIHIKRIVVKSPEPYEKIKNAFGNIIKTAEVEVINE